MAELVIREVVSNVRIFSVPFSRFNLIPFGGRSTAVRLQSGDVWILASTPLNDETKSTLDSMGPVRYICAADAEHSMYLAEYKKAYPTAKLIGVPGLVEKKRGVVEFDGVYGNDPPETKYGYEPEIQACYFSGYKNQDVAFLHTPSKTLIEADLLLNLPGKEQYSKSQSSPHIPILGSLSPMSGIHKWALWGATKDKAAMTRDARTVAGWDFDRVIPCHGDVIESGGKAAWQEAYKWFLDGHKKD